MADEQINGAVNEAAEDIYNNNINYMRYNLKQAHNIERIIGDGKKMAFDKIDKLDEEILDIEYEMKELAAVIGHCLDETDKVSSDMNDINNSKNEVEARIAELKRNDPEPLKAEKTKLQNQRTAIMTLLTLNTLNITNGLNILKEKGHRIPKQEKLPLEVIQKGDFLGNAADEIVPFTAPNRTNYKGAAREVLPSLATQNIKYNKELRDIDAQLVEIDAKLKEIEPVAEANKAELAGLEAKSADLDVQKNELDKRIGELAVKYNVLDSRITELKELKLDKQKERGTLSKNIIQYDKEIQDCKDKKSELIDKIRASMKAEKEAKQEDLAALGANTYKEKVLNEQKIVEQDKAAVELKSPEQKKEETQKVEKASHGLKALIKKAAERLFGNKEKTVSLDETSKNTQGEAPFGAGGTKYFEGKIAETHAAEEKNGNTGIANEGKGQLGSADIADDPFKKE